MGHATLAVAALEQPYLIIARHFVVYHSRAVVKKLGKVETQLLGHLDAFDCVWLRGQAGKERVSAIAIVGGAEV